MINLINVLKSLPIDDGYYEDMYPEIETGPVYRPTTAMSMETPPCLAHQLLPPTLPGMPQ